RGPARCQWTWSARPAAHWAVPRAIRVTRFLASRRSMRSAGTPGWGGVRSMWLAPAGGGCGGPGLVPAGPPQGWWSVVEVQVALGPLALVEGVGVGVVVVGQVRCLDQGIGQGPQRRGAAGDHGRAEPDDGLGAQQP